ncbi:MAG: OstA-like protein [Flavobacteriaceae bacterium]|nr:OstA-like protein [Flavobacteriaceae bacterium]
MIFITSLKSNITFLFFFIGLFINHSVYGQTKIIKIIQAGSFNKNEKIYPGANILLKRNATRVHLFHEGALIKSDKSYFYSKKNFFNAEGKIVFTQGDSIRMTSKYIEYNGNSKKAKAWGNVILVSPEMTLMTDTLFLDRIENTAFYKSPGKIIDSLSILNSKEGIYYLKNKKYNFKKNVTIDNPKYKVSSTQLDYFTKSNEAYFYGPSKIKGEDYDIYCERGFYNTKTQNGNFKKNAKIFYDKKIIEGDSLYFENDKKYASATNKIVITDTINNSIIKGDFGEIFKLKDSAIITKNALSINILDNDSLYIHADTLLITGPIENRLIKGYYNVKILKSDLKGKSDSLFFNERNGKIELLQKPLSRKEIQVLNQRDKNLKNPILWFDKNQISGEIINLISNPKTNKLDSLYIFGNSFIIEKDSISNTGFNQIKGKNLYGDFFEGKLKNIKVDKNTQVIYYMYSDEGELVGINKTICSSLKMEMNKNEIKEITFFTDPDGKVNPEKKIEKNLRKLDGFIWRINERPNNLSDLFD